MARAGNSAVAPGDARQTAAGMPFPENPAREKEAHLPRLPPPARIREANPALALSTSFPAMRTARATTDIAGIEACGAFDIAPAERQLPCATIPRPAAATARLPARSLRHCRREGPGKQYSRSSRSSSRQSSFKRSAKNASSQSRGWIQTTETTKLSELCFACRPRAKVNLPVGRPASGAHARLQ